MMSLTFGLFTQVSGLGPLGPLVLLVEISTINGNAFVNSNTVLSHFMAQLSITMMHN